MVHQLTVNRMTIGAGVLSSRKEVLQSRESDMVGIRRRRRRRRLPHIHDSVPTLFYLQLSAPTMVPFDGSIKGFIPTYLFWRSSNKINTVV